MTQNQDKQFLLNAIEKAKESVSKGGFPAGAVVVKDGKIIGSGISIGASLNDPTSHGEMASIREACQNLKTSGLRGAVLYASMQPCLMCFGVAMWSSISKIVYACSKDRVSDEYYGGHYKVANINTELIHPMEIVHIDDLEQASLDIVRKWEESFK